MKLVVTGAAGYLGQRVVLQALSMGHDVIAIVRPGRRTDSVLWSGADRIQVVELDLAADDSRQKMVKVFTGIGAGDVAVVHVAAALYGDDGAHARHTVEPTRRLIEAMEQAHWRRFVLVSSFSVYGYAALPDHAQLDEYTPLEPEPAQRDAYCRAKLEQEAIALVAAQSRGMLVSVLRPGMLYGSGRWWGPRLGVRFGPVGVLLGGSATLPVAHVDNCALAAVLAAISQSVPSDVHVKANDSGESGAFEAINVVDDQLPTQNQLAGAAARVVRGFPKVFTSVPWALLRRVTAVIALLTWVLPGLSAKLPGVLRQASLHARCKPLRFCNFRLHDRLGWVPLLSWKEALHQERNQVIRDER